MTDIPSPPGWPLLGNLLEINLEKPHLTFMKWSKQLGHMFTIRLFGTDTVVVSSFDLIHEVLVSKGSDFAGRPYIYRLAFMCHNNQDIIASSPNPRWAIVRKAVHRNLKVYDTGLQRVEDISMDIIGDVMRSLHS